MRGRGRRRRHGHGDDVVVSAVDMVAGRWGEVTAMNRATGAGERSPL